MSGTIPAMPVRDPRAAQDFYAGLSALQPAFLPELPPTPTGTDAAMRQILARFSAVVTQRLNQAPQLDKLAFLQMLGISLIPAQPARAPLVFTPLPQTSDAHIPAGTRAGASLPGITTPTVFETETEIALISGQLTQVVSLWPDQDSFTDHSSDYAGGRPFTLFQSPTPVTHVLYLGQSRVLAFKGQSTVEVRFDLSASGTTPITWRWEFWDGQTWRAFRDFDATQKAASQDGTAGLTRPGTVTLQAECGDSAVTSVANISSSWIRARATSPLPPNPSHVFALAKTVSLRTTINRPLTHGPGGCASPVPIDAAFAGTTTLDLTKIFYPMGKSPGPDAVFYLACEEIFSKPGAQVTLCLDLALTPEQEADKLAPNFAAAVTKAENDLLAAVRHAAEAAIDSAEYMTSLWYNTDTSAAQSAISALQTALKNLKKSSDIPALSTAFKNMVNAGSQIATGTLESIAAIDPSTPIEIITSPTAATGMLHAQGGDFSAFSELYKNLSNMTAAAAAGLAGGGPPTLPPPRLVWEYFDGTAWQTLVASSAAKPNNLLASGEIKFTVPQNIAPFTLNATPLLGLRARLASGSYNQLTLVTWTDPSSGATNVIPVLQPRPPSLSAIALGYTYRSPWTTPDSQLSWNDFQVEYHAPGDTYAPFHPVADTTPALYLGFNKPLPNDYLSIFFEIAETNTDGPPLVWEGFSAGAWQPLPVTDDTGALAPPRLVAFLDPGAPTRPTAAITAAAGTTVTAASPLAAAVFTPGQSIVIQPTQAAELATIAAIDGATITLVTPLAGTYATATTAALAALPRFGTPLDWVRARLKTDAPPQPARINGIYPNAAWANQVQTVTSETLGSGTGQPNLSFTFRQFPVTTGEIVQVRELVGAQAAVTYLVLQDQLLAQNFTQADIRTVTDPRSGQITEVWVTWQNQPNFFFSGPDDRHYVVDRATGHIIFGNGTNGAIPTAGNSNIMAYWYQAGGGLAGNVAAGAISQMLGGAAVQGVTNPVPAEGGADTEPSQNVNTRGPQVLRHRGAALSPADYEALALEASPGVAITRCLPATSENLRPAPGYVTLILVPRSLDPQPKPSYALNQEVAAYLAARAPSVIEPGRIAVIPPTYLPIGVSATVAARQLSQSGDVKTAVITALNAFFHPLTGGPDGTGWPFGRGVHLSDVAVLLEGLPGVDYVQNLELLMNEIPVGTQVTVPPERLVAAGPMLIVMAGAPSA